MADQGAVPAAQQPRVSVVCGDTHRASALDVDDPALTSEIKEIVAAAIARWLKNEEVYNLLEQFQVDDVTWAKEPADKPEGIRYLISLGSSSFQYGHFDPTHILLMSPFD